MAEPFVSVSRDPLPAAPAPDGRAAKVAELLRRHVELLAESAVAGLAEAEAAARHRAVGVKLTDVRRQLAALLPRGEL